MSKRKMTDEIRAKMLKLRKEHGLTYYALSLRFGISESVIERHLSGSEKGDTGVSPDCR
jgi:DNA-binding transcriptional ArsR family regulator